MSHTIKIYTFESVSMPVESDHPKARLVRTVAMAAADLDHRLCCQPMDMEPLEGAIVLKQSSFSKFYDRNQCRWCGQLWTLHEITDSNNKTFHEYRETVAEPAPLSHDEPSISLPFRQGIPCPHCTEGRMYWAVDGNFMCTHCKFGRTDPIKYRMEKGNCPACRVGVLVKRDDNSGHVKCFDCKYEGRMQ